MRIWQKITTLDYIPWRVPKNFTNNSYRGNLNSDSHDDSKNHMGLKNLLSISICIVILISYINQNNAHAKAVPLDVALILDTSASMKQNDPGRLRIQAARLFVSLLTRKDRVSLVGFSNRAYKITPLLSLNTKKNEKKLLQAIKQLNDNGKYTNLHDALLQGYELLKSNKQENRNRHIILMSDGKMDLGNKERNLRLLEQTLDELAPKLKAEGIQVHTIAFTKASYIPLLKLAAEDTEGQFILLKNAKGVHKVFENLFERSKVPEMLPVSEDNFVVDDEIDEITIVATKFKTSSKISLETPNGNEINKNNINKNINWFSADKFDLITIQKPATGYWLIKFSEGGNKAYILSDVKLNAISTKKRTEPGMPFHIQASLTKKNRRIKSNQILASTKFFVKITSPVGIEIENQLLDDGSEIGSERKDGIYGISYAFDAEGPYKIEVSAIGETFDRKKTLFIDVKSHGTQSPFKSFEKSKLTVKKDGNNNEQQTTTENSDSTQQPKASEVNKTDHNNVEETHGEEHSLENRHTEKDDHHKDHDKTNSKNEHDDLDTEHDDTLNENNHTDEHNDDEDHTENQADDKSLESTDGFSFGDAIIAFSMFNLFLLSLGGAYYIWYKRQQKKKSKDEDEDDQDNPDNDTENNKSEPSSAEAFSEVELEVEESFSTSISDIDLEEELSSLLDKDNNA